MTEQQWLFINARVSAVEALALAIASSLPQSEKIRAQLIEDTVNRRAALQLSPMPDDQIEASMEPFQRLIAVLESLNTDEGK